MATGTYTTLESSEPLFVLGETLRPLLTNAMGSAIEVFDTTSAASVPDRLSRGTAEQLYLALRLGLVDQLGEVGSGLPVLMDDVLVNFSPDRELILLMQRSSS